VAACGVVGEWATALRIITAALVWCPVGASAGVDVGDLLDVIFADFCLGK